MGWLAFFPPVKPRTPAVLLLAIALGATALAQHDFAPSDWAIRATFPALPKEDDQTVPTPQGDQLAQRRYVELGAERAMVIRFVYPVVPGADAGEQIYRESVETMMNSRQGELRVDEPFYFGDYTGRRLLIEHRRDKTHREVQLILIGSSLYVASAEWPGGRERPPSAARFLDSLAVQPAFSSARTVAERERWREFREGSFSLRYDATRWFRDPQVADPGTIVLLRVDELAEAEFLTSRERTDGDSMEETVLATAREQAESLKVHRRGRKLRGAASVEELRFAVRLEGVTYENHGYFYSGPEGTVQLRAWSPDKTFSRVESDISELLDGLVVTRALGSTGR